ncbi:MAG: efflux RND transporter periplasmic adaptor subunit [Sulfuricellaceae bacterium]|nr:efflux RND transporter periplasmic adaptor subunit [Sulfuricellaceae bacterium]
MTKITVVCAALMAIFAVVQMAAASDEIRISENQASKMGITTQALSAAASGNGVSLPGQVVVPNGQLQLVSVSVAGVVEALPVTVNQTVKKGQVLARIQSPGLIAAQREFLTAYIQAQLAGQGLKRDESLFRDGIISEGRYLTTRGAATQADAMLAQMEQSLRLYGMSGEAVRRLQSSRHLSASLDVVSPIDGTVLEQMATVGQRTEASAPLFKVAKLSPLWLEFQATVDLASKLKVGALITLVAQQAAGKIVSLGRQLNPANQTVLVRAEITRGTENLQAGQYIEALVSVPGNQKGLWVVPNAALVRSQGKTYLFVQTKNGFALCLVRVIQEMAQFSTVEAKLKGSERIAVTGVSALKASWMGLGGGE